MKTRLDSKSFVTPVNKPFCLPNLVATYNSLNKNCFQKLHFCKEVDLIHNSYSIAVGIKLKQGNEYQLAVKNENSFISNYFVNFFSARGCAKENRNDEGNDIAELLYIKYHYTKITL